MSLPWLPAKEKETTRPCYRHSGLKKNRNIVQALNCFQNMAQDPTEPKNRLKMTPDSHLGERRKQNIDWK